MGTNCAPLVADLFLCCYERDFMTSLSVDNQADIIKAFNTPSVVKVSCLLSGVSSLLNGQVFFLMWGDLSQGELSLGES